MSLELDLVIDEYNLVNEWLHQATLFNQYCGIKSDWERIVAKDKEKVEVCKASLVRRIHSCPADFDMKKTTEICVNAAITEDAEYQQLKDNLIASTYEKDMASNAVRAVEMRKSGLENIVKLFGQNYYSEPIASGKGTKNVVEDLKSDTSKQEYRRKRQAERESRKRGSEDQ